MADKRHPAQLEKDRAIEADMYCRGATQVEIAARVGMSVGAIKNDLKVILAHWRESQLVDMDDAKARELARIDHLEREYWEAWDKSRTTKTRTRTARTDSEERGKTDVAEVVSEEAVGDSTFLRGVQWCIEQRVKILGLYAPEKVEHIDGGMLGAKTDSELLAILNTCNAAEQQNASARN